PEVGERIYKEWQGDSLNLTAKVVCGPCNSGWMSDLENEEAKPILKDMIVHGSAVSLFPRGIVSIAAFAFKSAVIGDHMNYPANHFFSHDVRRQFMVSLDLPRGIQIWVTSYNTPRKRGGYFSGRYPYIERSVPKGFQLYVFTYCIGYFMFQLVAFKYHRSRFRKHAAPLTLHPDTFWNKIAIPLWPNDGSSVEWPPPLQLQSELVETFSDRWARFDAPRELLW
ncbi:MAG TPA: hypothetical protein VJ521_01695, partial [Acidobacteriota bacterium]|nr:hypothetical protein [Acidobacteriota bacterium]